MESKILDINPSSKWVDDRGWVGKNIIRCSNGFAMPREFGASCAFFTNCQVSRRRALEMLLAMGYQRFGDKAYFFNGRLQVYGRRYPVVYNERYGEPEIIRTDANGKPVSIDSGKSFVKGIDQDLDPYSKLHDLTYEETREKRYYTPNDFIAYLKKRTLKLGKRSGMGAADILSLPVGTEFAQVRESVYTYEPDYTGLVDIAKGNMSDETKKRFGIGDCWIGGRLTENRAFYCLDYLCNLVGVNVTQEVTKKGTRRVLDSLLWTVDPLILLVRHKKR